MRSVSTGGVRVSRFLVWLFACVTGLLAPATSHAQTTYTWNQATSGQAWQTASNWLPNTGFPNAISDVAIFGNVLTGANSVTLSSSVTIGELRFEDVNTNSTTAAYTIGSSSQSITFNNGASPSLLNVTGFTLANQTVATNVVIGGTQPLTITNNGAPGVTTLTLSGALSASTSGTALNVGGSSNTAISGVIGNTVGTLTKSGSGVLDLSGRTAANTYTGGTVINGGTIKITNTTNGVTFFSQLGTGAVTLNGGALHVAADTFVDNNFTLGASGGTIISTAGDGNSDPTFRGVFSGSGSLTIDGGSWADFTKNNTYTGATVINNAGVTLLDASKFSLTSSVTINGYVGGQIGLLSLNNFSSADSDRVRDAAPVILNGGLISILPGLLADANETFGDLTVKGYGSLYGNQTAGALGKGSMLFGALTRFDSFSTIYVGGPVYGPPQGGTNIQIKFASGISASGGSNQTLAVVPWIGGDRGKTDLISGAITPSGYAGTLFAYSATDGLIALDSNSNTNFFQVTAGSAFNGVVPGAKNNAISGSPSAVNSSITILSLVQNPTSPVSTISGSGTLTVSSGAIANVNQMVFDGPTLNFGSNTGYLWLGNSFVVAGATGVTGTSRITGTNGLVVSSNSDDGRNELYLLNTLNPNTFTGGLYLNGTARVAFDTADSQLGAAGEVVSLRGGTLMYIGDSAATLSTSGTNRPIQLTAAGGGIIRVDSSSGILTVPGLISGTEQLTVTGPGTLVLSNTANTYAGGTTIGDSIVRIAAPGSLGTGDITLGVKIGTDTFSGGTLRFDGAGTVTANVKHDFSSTLNTNGNNVTISGIVSGNGAVLTKAGGGTLTLSAANTYTGNTQITGGTLLVTNTTGSGTGYGAVTVKTGGTMGGTGTVAGAVSVENGGSLSVGATGGLGKLTFRGSTTLASGSNYLTGLAGTTAGTQYGQLVIKPGGSIALGNSTFQPTLSYAPSNGDKLFLIDNQNSSGGLSGTFNGLANNATYTFGDGTTAQISYFGDYGSVSITGGNDLVLYNFVPVPEPASVLGVAVLALGALTWGSRRRVASAIAR